MAPKRIYMTEALASSLTDKDTEEYIRADLVEKLKGYAVHDPHCDYEPGECGCTCGLTEVLKEMDDES